MVELVETPNRFFTQRPSSKMKTRASRTNVKLKHWSETPKSSQPAEKSNLINPCLSESKSSSSKSRCLLLQSVTNSFKRVKGSHGSLQCIYSSLLQSRQNWMDSMRRKHPQTNRRQNKDEPRQANMA